jgi:hypothetical protein
MTRFSAQTSPDAVVASDDNNRPIVIAFIAGETYMLKMPFPSCDVTVGFKDKATAESFLTDLHAAWFGIKS